MSGFPKQCCASGSLHTGIPVGRDEVVHGRKCYISDPPSGAAPKGVIVIISDIFGYQLPNSRILADEYAKQTNSTVYLPDFMNGAALPADTLLSIHALFATGIWAQMAKVYHFLVLLRYFIPFKIANPDSKSRAQISDFCKALRKDQASDLPIGAAGFCWGGKWVVELCADKFKTSDGKSLIDVGYTAHPSQLVIPDDINNVVLPLSISACEIDPGFNRKQYETARDILAAKSTKGKDEGIEHETVWYPKAFHGFAVRADENDKEEAARGKQAEKQAVDWFNKWFDAYEN